MTAPVPCVVVFNGGSLSIRFAVYEASDTLRRRLDGKIDRIGVSDTTFMVNDPGGTSQASRPLAAADYGTAVDALLEWLEAQPIFASVTAAGHRVVHGMQHFEPEPVTPALLAQLRRITPYAPDHLPGEIALIEHKQYIAAHGEDMPEIRNWKWGTSEAQTQTPRKKQPRAHRATYKRPKAQR